MPNHIKQFVDHVITTPYLYALTIVVMSMLLAAVVNIIMQVMIRFTSKTKTTLDDKIMSILHRPVFVTIVLAGAAYAMRQLGSSDNSVRFGDALLFTLVVVIWTGAAMRIGKIVLQILSDQADKRPFVQPSTLPLFEIALKTLVVGLSVYCIFIIWNINVTAWLASAGVIGIAVGFAAKDTLSNLFSGIFILADRPYKIGDYIVLDSGERGMVTDIGIRSTRMLTRDDIEIILPNAAIANAKIINESGGYNTKARIRIDVSVAYGSDIDKVREILLDVAAKSQYLVKEPIPRVRFRSFGDSSLNFQLLGWIPEPVFRGRTIDELNTAIYKRFNKESIEIPFPQRDVHIKQS
ncbi:MAG: mechanosensitive ion channel domain-containing protein [Syntrophales bacterium]